MIPESNIIQVRDELQRRLEKETKEQEITKLLKAIERLENLLYGRNETGTN